MDVTHDLRSYTSTSPNRAPACQGSLSSTLESTLFETKIHLQLKIFEQWFLGWDYRPEER